MSKFEEQVKRVIEEAVNHPSTDYHEVQKVKAVPPEGEGADSQT